jgi:xanthine dehydrogenase accessory factor
MQALLQQLLSTVQSGTPVVFTALVETRGSTPQKAGAAMLVFPDGSQAGTLGGGCVEAEVKRRALEILSSGERQLLTFQLDHDYGWDDGLICGGRMVMLVDPVRTVADTSYYQEFVERLSAGRGVTEATVLSEGFSDAPAGARFLIDRDGDVVAQQGAESAPAAMVAGAKALAERPRPYVAGGVSYLPHLPRCRLVIVGGGHVGTKVAALAAEVDFDVWVCDDREEFCNPQRFPAAQRLLCGPIEDVLSGLEIDGDTFCIIVTRGHNHDETALFHVVEKPARYIGMIGSKRKIRLIFDDLRRMGVADELLARVHAPIGFDIGSQTVPEIAVSIVAELIACRSGRAVDHGHELARKALRVPTTISEARSCS